jgi:uncharacterized protein (TIGR03435 family)
MSAFARVLSSALIDFFWQGAVIGLLLWALLVILRHRSASVRYTVSCAALLVLAVLPVLTIVALWLQTIAPAQLSAAAAASAPSRPEVSQTMLQIWLVSEEPHIAWLARIQQWALPIWSAGVLLLSGRLAWASARVLTLERRAQPADGLAHSARMLANRIGIDRPVRVLTSPSTDGPGVIGWRRPAILMPPASSMGLTQQQLEAVLAHELAHIKRHDYLINIFQMITETMLFYHPAVWWISRQIRLERELCCDDIAVRACGDPVVYARALSILARRQLASPAFSMAATAGPLVHRVKRLLGGADPEYAPSRLPAAIVLCVAIGAVILNLDRMEASDDWQSSDHPRFEVASIKPNNRNDNIIMVSGQNGQYRAIGVSLRVLIQSAYQVQEFQIIGGPRWLDSNRFDILAKEESSAPDAGEKGLSPSRQQFMLRALLAERFNLAVHKETRDMPIFALVPARSDHRLGPQMQRSTLDCSVEGARAAAGRGVRAPSEPSNPFSRPPRCGTSVGPGLILAGGTTMAEVASAFARLTNTGSSLNRLVIDRSGLEGRYDLELRFTPERIPNLPPDDPRASFVPPVDPNGPSIFTAVQEQLGLKLDPQRGPVEVLVIDRVDQPTPD